MAAPGIQRLRREFTATSIRFAATELRSRVTFARRIDTTDEYGGTGGEWQDQFTVAANIRPRLGGETVEAARLTGRQPYVIRVRQSPATRQINTDWRATNVDTGMVYNVRSTADPHEGDKDHGRFIDMLAETGAAV
jgi:SPP1 family predicted phage head-tail adaptor